MFLQSFLLIACCPTLNVLLEHDVKDKQGKFEGVYRNDCISCLPDLITAPELVTALDSTEKILLVTLLYH